MRRAVGAPAVAPFGRMLLMQTWSRLLWFWRIPAWTVSSLAMPVFFFTFFGLRFARTRPEGPQVAPPPDGSLDRLLGVHRQQPEGLRQPASHHRRHHHRESGNLQREVDT